MSNLNSPPSAQGSGANHDEDDSITAFHEQLRAIQGRLEKTAVVGESLSSAQHEIQLHLQALSSRSNSSYNAEADAKAAELKQRIKNLSQEANELTSRSSFLSRRTENDSDESDLVCNFTSDISMS